MGACSADFAVMTLSVPFSMTQPTTFVVLPNQISLNWTSETLTSQTGGSPITYYELRYKANVGDTYTALTVSSGGLKYYFDHKLTGAVFPPNQNVYYTVCAQNLVGMGACSTDFTVLTCDYPTFMNPPIYVNDGTMIQPPWIYLTWNAITTQAQMGRASVTFYDLEWDSGTNQVTWTSLITGTTLVTAFNHTIFPSVFPSG